MKLTKKLFPIKDNLLPIKGYTRQHEEGNVFWLNEPGEKINFFLDDIKLRLIFIFVFVVFIVIWSRLFWLQVVQGSHYNFIAQGNRLRQEMIPAERGIIYDRFSTPLVSNIPDFSLYFTPADLPKDVRRRQQLIKSLAIILKQSPVKLKNLFNSVSVSGGQYLPVLITNNLTHEQVISLKVATGSLAGVNLKIEPRRSYLEDSGLSHILGYVGKISQQELSSLTYKNYQANDYLGKAGIELFYEKYLRGQPGYQTVEVDSLGKVQKVLNRIEPKIGHDIVLTLDLKLQQKLTHVLSEAVKHDPTATGAAAIALNPNSGEILALVSLPDYDNNFFSAGILKKAYQNYLNDPRRPLFNRAIAGNYPPGSTFKPLVAVAALEENIINSQTTFLSTGGLRVGRWFFPDWKAGGHGITNVIKAIAQSVNTFFYYIGGGYHNFTGLGVDRIINYARKFYFGRTLGVDLPGEAKGFLPTREWKKRVKNEAWYIGDTYHLAIGQGDILVTPLQLASYTATLANGGTLYRPHFLKFIRDKKQIFSSNDEKDDILNRQIASEKSIKLVRQGMRATVLNGSARSLQFLPVAAAGKTGTAQIGKNKFHAWFTGFAPYNNPQIVLTILIENGGEGSTYAVPVFKQIIKWYFSDRNNS